MFGIRHLTRGHVVGWFIAIASRIGNRERWRDAGLPLSEETTIIELPIIVVFPFSSRLAKIDFFKLWDQWPLDDFVDWLSTIIWVFYRPKSKSYNVIR